MHRVGRIFRHILKAANGPRTLSPLDFESGGFFMVKERYGILNMSMEIWLDSVNLEEIRAIAPKVIGLTTNPLLLHKFYGTTHLTADQLEEYFDEIFRAVNGKPVFLQVVSIDTATIIKEAHALAHFAKNLGGSAGVKIPVTSDGIAAMQQLVNDGYLVLGTAVFTPEQGYCIGETGAQYLAPYVARATAHHRQMNTGVDGVELVRQLGHILGRHRFPAKVMAANFRVGETEVNDVIGTGVAAITVPASIYRTMDTQSRGTTDPKPFTHAPADRLSTILQHPQTKKAITDFTEALRASPAYVRIIYRQILGRDLSDNEINNILQRVGTTLQAEYHP